MNPKKWNLISKINFMIAKDIEKFIKSKKKDYKNRPSYLFDEIIRGSKQFKEWEKSNNIDSAD